MMDKIVKSHKKGLKQRSSSPIVKAPWKKEEFD